MKNNPPQNTSFNDAQNYYPQSFPGESTQKASTPSQSSTPPTPQDFFSSSAFSSLLQGLLTGGGLKGLQDSPLSAIFSSQSNKNDILSKLLTSLTNKKDSSTCEEKTIDITNSIEEL